MEGELTFRPATKADASALAVLVDIAGEGLPAHLWSTLKVPGQSILEVGRERAVREQGGFSYRNAIVAEVGGEIAACLVGYRLDDPYDPGNLAEIPELVRPLVLLEAKAPGSWYVNVLATFHEFFLTQCIYIAWNHDRFPFGDARVRRAMTLLFPRQQVRDAKYLGHAIVLSGPWPGGAPELDPTIEPLPCDAAQAAKLLAEAGFADSDGDGVLDKDGKPFRFELSVPETTTPALDAGNLWFQEKLKRAGVTMSIKVVNSQQLFSSDLPKHEFDGAEVGWGGDPSEDDLFERFHSHSIEHGRNYFGYRSPDCDRLIESWRREFDRDKRIAIAHALHRRIAEDQPATFLFNPQSLVLATTKLRNVKVHRLGARWFDWWFSAP